MGGIIHDLAHRTLPPSPHRTFPLEKDAPVTEQGGGGVVCVSFQQTPRVSRKAGTASNKTLLNFLLFMKYH